MQKNAILTLLFSLFFSFLSAQVWLEIGPKASFGPSGYVNGTILNDDKHDYSLNLAFNYGGVVGFNIGDYHGLNLEALWGTYFQNITYLGDDGPRRNSLEWEVTDLYLLYRYYPESGYYFELGPKFTLVNDRQQTFGVEFVDTKGLYEDKYVSAVAGLGAFLAGSEVMVIKAGLRFEYGLTDMVSADGMSAGFPAYYADLGSLGSTQAFRVSFGLEMSFGVGGFAQGAC
ncbi:MAG: hypothetical protein KDC54_22140, partial [Lewinella sp.]|nr:hypothetical protein [Lewinella sp.]